MHGRRLMLVIPVPLSDHEHLKPHPSASSAITPNFTQWQSSLVCLDDRLRRPQAVPQWTDSGRRPAGRRRSQRAVTPRRIGCGRNNCCAAYKLLSNVW